MRTLLVRGAGLLLAVALTACGGGGGGGSKTVPSVTPTTDSGTLSLTFNQRAQATHRAKPQFLSPSAQSVSIAVSGVTKPTIANVSATSPDCTTTAGVRSCNVPITSPLGATTFTVTLYDGPNATGNVLGTGTANATIVAGTAFTVTIPVAGAPGAITIAATTATFTAGTAATTPLTVTVTDADGNVITGTYEHPVALTTSDTTGAFTLSAASVTTSSQAVTLKYSGSTAVTSVTISGSATGVPAANIKPQIVSVTTPVVNLYVAQIGTPAITVTPATASGNAAPTQTISGANTQLFQPYDVKLDSSGNIYASGLRSRAIWVYAAGANGNVAPIRTITGSNTGLIAPLGLVFDSAGELVVSDYGATSVFVFAAGANGSVTPLRAIAGANTGLIEPYGVTLDAAGNIYVVNDASQGPKAPDSVTVYAPGANGNVAPIRTISGALAGLTLTSGAVFDAIDSAGNLYVSCSGSNSINVYAPGANGNVAPIRTITGTNTTLSRPAGLGFDSAGNLYVVNDGNNTLAVFAPGANGNATPLRALAGANIGFNGADGIAIGAATLLSGPAPAITPTPTPTPTATPTPIASATPTPGPPYLVAVEATSNSITVTPLNASGNIAPLETINVPTGLYQPADVIFDSSGNLYACGTIPAANPANNGGVWVYAAGANGNAAAIRTIAGAQTGLVVPQGMAFDSSGELYVSNRGNIPSQNSITVFAAGANGNVAPIRTIEGPNTGLTYVNGIALDAAGDLYVVNDDNGASQVTVYAPGASGNVAPIRTISGANTGLTYSLEPAIDSAGNLYVSNNDQNNTGVGDSITVYAPGSNGNVAPIRTITGANTQLYIPIGLAIDSLGNLYVGNYSANDLLVYAAGANGNVAPIRTVSGPNTGIDGPSGITIGP